MAWYCQNASGAGAGLNLLVSVQLLGLSRRSERHKNYIQMIKALSDSISRGNPMIFMGKFLNIIVFIAAIGCNVSTQIFPLPSKDIEAWRRDTCGIYNQRYGISQKMLSRRKRIVGLSEYQLISALGRPDFTIPYGDVMLGENVSAYEYSTSSIEFIDGKCGDPIAYSICFMVDTQSHKIVQVSQFVH